MLQLAMCLTEPPVWIKSNERKVKYWWFSLHRNLESEAEQHFFHLGMKGQTLSNVERLERGIFLYKKKILTTAIQYRREQKSIQHMVVRILTWMKVCFGNSPNAVIHEAYDIDIVYHERWGKDVKMNICPDMEWQFSVMRVSGYLGLW